MQNKKPIHAIIITQSLTNHFLIPSNAPTPSSSSITPNLQSPRKKRWPDENAEPGAGPMRRRIVVVLIFCLLFYQEKRSSLPGNEGKTKNHFPYILLLKLISHSRTSWSRKELGIASFFIKKTCAASIETFKKQ